MKAPHCGAFLFPVSVVRSLWLPLRSTDKRCVMPGKDAAFHERMIGAEPQSGFGLSELFGAAGRQS